MAFDQRVTTLTWCHWQKSRSHWYDTGEWGNSPSWTGKVSYCFPSIFQLISHLLQSNKQKPLQRRRISLLIHLWTKSQPLPQKPMTKNRKRSVSRLSVQINETSRHFKQQHHHHHQWQIKKRLKWFVKFLFLFFFFL